MMRPDIYNLYGAQCPFIATPNTFVCPEHLNGLPVGIWNGVYTGSLKYHMEKVPYERLQRFTPF